MTRGKPAAPVRGWLACCGHAAEAGFAVANPADPADVRAGAGAHAPAQIKADSGATAPKSGRRRLLGLGVATGLSAGLGALMPALAAGDLADARAMDDRALSQAERDAMTPDGVLDMLREGNRRFVTGRPHPQDFVAQMRSSRKAQYPAAVVLGCIDSRAPATIIFDSGIGDVFNARVAGNIANADIVGSLEYGCAAAGAKVVLVMGHTGCGAIKGAIEGTRMGSLTGLLAAIRPAVDATAYAGERSARNPEFVDAVARTNVLHTIAAIRATSPILDDLERRGRIRIAGSMYDLATGALAFVA